MKVNLPGMVTHTFLALRRQRLADKRLHSRPDWYSTARARETLS